MVVVTKLPRRGSILIVTPIGKKFKLRRSVLTGQDAPPELEKTRSAVSY
jgi:hypothetical protein